MKKNRTEYFHANINKFITSTQSQPSKRQKKKEMEYTGEVCPDCGAPLVYREKNGKKFIACSNYPTCKYVCSEPKEIKPVKKCPHCEDGYLIKKKGKYGYFLGCTNYPKCNYMEKIYKRGRK